jgi:acid phosphatase
MKISVLLFFGIAFIAGCSPSEIINLDTAKKLVQDYYEKGDYDNECEKIINEAEKEILNLAPDTGSTVIFDVDDTVLSNYEYTKQLGFGYNHTTYMDWVNNSRFKVIPKTKAFYDRLLTKKIRIVFLTGRYSEAYSGTRKNLIDAGFTKFDTLIVRSINEKKLPAAEYKSAKREELTGKGYNIIASIGDQASDLKGKFVGIKVKLPNYLYGIE